MMDQMEATRLAALSPHDRAVKLAAQAKEYFNRGLLLEAERLYQAADGRRRFAGGGACWIGGGS